MQFQPFHKMNPLAVTKMNGSKFNGISRNNLKKSTFIKVVENETKMCANVIMQRMPVNSFNLELLEELTFTIKELERKRFRGMILTSSSPTVFSAGLDFIELYNPEEFRLRKFWKALQNLWKTLYLTPLITIAAINGHAPAGGCLIALSCDHSIMVKTKAKIGLPATKLGFPIPKWLGTLYINAIGFHRAEHAMKLGEMFSAEEAFKMSMIDEVVEAPADLMTKAEEQLDKWLKIPESAFRRTKLCFRQPYVDDMISYEADEVEEVVEAFLLEESQNIIFNYIKGLKNTKNQR